jgi:transposase
MSRRAGERLLGIAEAVRQMILLAPVKHLDETGFRIVKTLKWLHIAATGWSTYYRIGADRGDMLSGVSGIVVHDHWQSYLALVGFRGGDLWGMATIGGLWSDEQPDIPAWERML